MTPHHIALARGAARNRRLPAALLQQLIECLPVEDWLELADATNLTPALARMLADRGGPEVATALAYRGALGWRTSTTFPMPRPSCASTFGPGGGSGPWAERFVP